LTSAIIVQERGIYAEHPTLALQTRNTLAPDISNARMYIIGKNKFKLPWKLERINHAGKRKLNIDRRTIA
jgi:hypothetical protein